MEECRFCKIANEKFHILFETDLATAFYDTYPVNVGHVLIVPKRHCETYFDLTKEELADMFELSKKVKDLLDKEFEPAGYNVGFNCYAAGGQTVMHAHMHVIPRYEGDCDNPRGGIRKAVKRKDNY